VSNVIQLHKNGRPITVQSGHDETRRVIAAIQDKAELICWRLMSTALRMLEERANQYEDTLTALGESAEKSRVMIDLTVAREEIHKALADCVARADTLECRIDQ
jgi:hypothetical protein